MGLFRDAGDAPEGSGEFPAHVGEFPGKAADFPIHGGDFPSEVGGSPGSSVVPPDDAEGLLAGSGEGVGGQKSLNFPIFQSVFDL